MPAELTREELRELDVVAVKVVRETVSRAVAPAIGC
jgi:hypothetical protein